MGPLGCSKQPPLMRSFLAIFTAAAAVLSAVSLRAADTTASPAAAGPPDFAVVYRILDERCLECHAKDDYEGGLVLEDHASLLKGGETGVAVVPGKSAESLLIKYLHG